MREQATKERDDFISRMANYEKISAILWLVLGILQIISIITIIAGIWNLFAASSRFKMAKRIRAIDASVPLAYEGMGQLILVGLINLFLGAVIGVIFVALDYYIRDQILKHRHHFAGELSESNQDIYTQLKRVDSLRKKGVIDEFEYRMMKQGLLETLIKIR